MTIAIFGGTGLTGRECVYQALMANENVIVLAKDPYKLRVPDRLDMDGKLMTDPRLTVIKGDVKSQDDVDSIFDAAGDITGAIIVLGGKSKEVGKTMLTEGTANIINSMKHKSSAKRIAVVTSIGTGDSQDQAPLMFKILQKTVMKSVFEDKNNQEKLFLEGPGKELDYCLVRPGACASLVIFRPEHTHFIIFLFHTTSFMSCIPGPKFTFFSSHFCLKIIHPPGGLGVGQPEGVINVIKGQAGSIQRADIAAFLLGAVKDANFPYLKQTPCVSSVSGTGWVKEKKEGFDAVTSA